MNTIIQSRDGVRVQIFGREYDMDPGDLTPLEIQSLASYVDEKMRDISEKHQLVDTQKIAVLAALNIALDYLQLKEQKDKAGALPIGKLEPLIHLLDQALHTTV